MEDKLINVRKLAALDIYLHSLRFIIAEFGIGTPVPQLQSTLVNLQDAFWLGFCLLLTGINCIPLLFYAVMIVKIKTAESEVATDFARDMHFIRKYSSQELIIFVPFAILFNSIPQGVEALSPRLIEATICRQRKRV